MLSAVLLAVVTGVSEAVGGQLWDGVVSLVRRPLRRKAGQAGETAMRSGRAEAAALERSPSERGKAVALAEVLLARAEADAGFGQALQEWWDRAEPVRASLGDVSNTISGGTFSGPVLQGRDFTGLTFGNSPQGQGRNPATSTGGHTGNAITSGSFAGPVVQGRDFRDVHFGDVIHQPAAAPVALEQLPALPTAFVGREAELAELAAGLGPAAGPGAVVVSAVAGLAGVGKTALAIQAAHAARQAGWLAGGVLFVNLHGYEQALVRPGQALDALLRALGVPGERIPPGDEERAGLYRSELARIGDPVLVIADNASSEEQVRLLLPGPGPHKVVVTSRHTLAGLGARLLDVGVLRQESAVRLLDELVRAARPGDDRITAHPEAAARLAAVCAGLPLALQITGALLVGDPFLTVPDLCGELANEVHRLEALAYDDGGGTSAVSVAAAFELSYRQLPEPAARMFRLLAAHPGPDMSAAVAAALTGEAVSQARQVIRQLMMAHLIEPAGDAGATGRWRMHDLVRLYARQLSDHHARADDRDRALDRLLAYYLATADAADDHLRALPGTLVPAQFTDRDDALAWLDAERPSLIAAINTIATAGRDDAAMRLPLYLSEYLHQRRRFDDMLTVLPISYDAAKRLNDRPGQSKALTNLGIALTQVQRFDEAITALRDAADILHQVGERHLEGMTLTNLGIALREVGRFDEAIAAFRNATDILRQVGDPHSEGMVLTNLGNVLWDMRRFDEAITAHRDATDIFGQADDQYGEGMALGNLGDALRYAGRFDEAIIACEQSLAICRKIGDRYGEGVALDSLGIVLRQVRRFDEAITAHRDAADIFRQTGDQDRESEAAANLRSAQEAKDA